MSTSVPIGPVNQPLPAPDPYTYYGPPVTTWDRTGEILALLERIAVALEAVASRQHPEEPVTS